MSRRIIVTSMAFILLIALVRSAPITTASAPAPDLMLLNTAVFTQPGSINAIVPLTNNRVLVGGRFVTIAGQSTPQSLAIVQPDGSIDASFRVDADLIVETITDIAVQNDGKILLAGMFRRASSPGTIFLLRLQPDGKIDPLFDTFAIYGNVYTVLVDNNKILVGGNFSSPSRYLARLNPDGSPDPSFTPGTGPDGPVYDLARQSNGQYLIVGDFNTYNGAGQVGLARLQANGTLDTSFAPGGFRPSRRVAVISDGTVLVGGDGICGSGQSFAWYTPAGVARPLPDWPAPTLLQSITALLPLPDGGFLVGGWYSNVCINGSPTQHRGEVWRYAANGDYHTLVSLDESSDVLAMARRSDGYVVVGGSGVGGSGVFDGLGLLTTMDNGLERIASFHPLVGDETVITSLSVYPDGRVLVGGRFSHVNGQPRFGLARLSADGQLDDGFAPLARQPGSSVGVVLALPDGRAIIENYGGLYLVTQDQQLTNLSALMAYQFPYALLLQPDGRVLVGGSRFVHRLNAGLNGIDMQLDAGGRVYDLAIDPVSGKIVVAGSMGVLRLNNDGTFDPQFSAPIFTRSSWPAVIKSIAFTNDGKLLVGGDFDRVDGAEWASLVRLTNTGALDTTFPALTDLGAINSICVQSADGAIWIGGSTLTRVSASGLEQRAFANRPFHLTGSSVNRLICAGDSLRWVGGFAGFFDQQPLYGVSRALIARSRVFIPLVGR